MGWVIALAVIIAIGLLPVGIRLIYEASGLELAVLVGPLKFPLELDKKEKKPKKKDNTSKQSGKKQVSEKGGSLSDFLPLLQVIKEFLGDLRKKIRVKMLKMRLTMAGDDPCDLAVNYGKAWAAVGNLMPLLEQLFVIKKRDVQVACDFVGSQTVLYLRVDAAMGLGRLLGLLLRHGFRGIREYMKIIEKRKGGAIK